MLTPEQQAKAYDEGYFYPGPAVKDVDARPWRRRRARTRSRSSAAPSTTQLIAGNPTEVPLDAKAWWPRSTSGTARSAAAKVKK